MGTDRDDALELHDTVLQDLVQAKWALSVRDVDEAARCVDRATDAMQAYVSQRLPVKA